jgi:hypothetical protein
MCAAGRLAYLGVTDSSAGDSAPEEATPIFYAVQRYIAALRAAESGTTGVADRLAGVLGVGIPDVVAAAREVAAKASLSGEGPILAEGGLRLPRFAFAGVAEVRAQLAG